MTARLALYTFGVFAAPAEDPVNDGFRARNDPIMAHVERYPGFLARSGYADEPGPDSWGEEIYPRFYTERGDGWSPATLSLWRDLESPMAFAYSGLHAEALANARSWFVPPEWPGYVLWWVKGSEPPYWSEAAGRLELLHDEGATPRAFDFKSPFDVAGNPTSVDRKAMRAIVDTAGR